MRSATSPATRLAPTSPNPHGPASRTLIAATVAMALLLIGLAILQFRWVDQVSQAERERLRRALRTSADRIADDFDREIFRAFIAFQPHRQQDVALAERLADGWERWRASALEPSLVKAVYVLGPQADVDGKGGGDSLAVLDPQARALRPAEWPRELAMLEALFERTAARRSAAGLVRRPWEPVLPSAPALILPLWPSRDRGDEAPSAKPGDRPGEAANEPPAPSTPMGQPSAIVVLLDRNVVADSVLPTLVDLHLGAAPRDTQVWVLDRARRDEMLYSTKPGSLPPPRHADDDATMRTLLDLRFFPELRTQGFQHAFDDPDTRRQLAGAPWPRAFGDRARERPGGWHPDRGPDHGPDSTEHAPLEDRPPGGGRPGGPQEFRSRLGAGGDQRAWTLVLAPVEGSLDAAVAKLRRRNLGVGLGVVLLLGATSALLLVSARQAQSLARREMELVAGITHELRTPLASIASAADNLADGVVREPDQIRRYGGLIKGEAHRLGALVAQVLDFAGSAAVGRRARPVEPVDLDAIFDRVLDDHRFTLEEKKFVVDRGEPTYTARAMADPEALRRALDNVVGNALKYGEEGRFLGIEITAPGTGARPATGASSEGRVAIRVRDRGPGIARSERRRVFEPFYRAAGALHHHGTGLGLAVTKSVIESLGGTIEIEDGPGGRGATFVITLRAAPAEAAPEQAPVESPV